MYTVQGLLALGWRHWVLAKWDPHTSTVPSAVKGDSKTRFHQITGCHISGGGEKGEKYVECPSPPWTLGASESPGRLSCWRILWKMRIPDMFRHETHKMENRAFLRFHEDRFPWKKFRTIGKKCRLQGRLIYLHLSRAHPTWALPGSN